MAMINGRFHLRIISSGMFWSAWAYAAAIAGVILLLQQFIGGPVQLVTMMKTLTIALPVFTNLIFANLLAEEFEQRLFAHLYTFRYSLTRIVSERLLIAAISLLVVWVIWSVCALLTMPGLSMDAMIHTTMVIVPTNLLLGMFVLLAVLIGKNIVVGLIFGFIFWFVEVMGRGWHWPIRLTWYEVPDHEMGRLIYSLLLIGLFVLAWLLVLAVIRFFKTWVIR